MGRNPIEPLYLSMLYFQLRMVMTMRGGSVSRSGSGLGSGLGVEPIDERLCKLIATEVTRDILDATPLIFGTIKEGIMEIMEERLHSF